MGYPCGNVCEGTGYAPVYRDGVRVGVARCVCRQQAFTPIADLPTIADPHVRRFAEFLHERAAGRAKAITRKTIAAKFPKLVDQLGGTRDFERKLRALARAAVAAGVPVVGSNSGYYLAVAVDDFDEPIWRLDSQIKDETEHLARLQRLRAKLEGPNANA